MNRDLMRAIVEKRLIEFIYRVGGTRVVEPHDYGIRGGVESLLGFQIAGDSRSGAAHGWKQFEIDGMHRLHVLERRFAGTRADSQQHHRRWDTLFARGGVIASDGTALRRARSRKATRNSSTLLSRPLEWMLFHEDSALPGGAVFGRCRRKLKTDRHYDRLLAGRPRRRDATLVTANTKEFARVPGLN